MLYNPFQVPEFINFLHVITEYNILHYNNSCHFGATAVLVLQDGRQRNSDAIEVVFRDILGTEMKMYGAAIAQVG